MPKRSDILLKKRGKIFASFLILVGKSSFSSFGMILAVGLVVDNLYQVVEGSSIPSFLRIFVICGY